MFFLSGIFLCTGSPKGKRCLTATGDPRASRVRLRLPYSITLLLQNASGVSSKKLIADYFLIVK